MEVREPDMLITNYSYADYLRWNIPEMVELIKGKVFKMSAAPRRIHQKISGILFNQLYNFLEFIKCEVYEAPFDVRLPVNSKKNDAIYTVVQPDICVICDLEKLDEAGCCGAPDLIIEILSPGNNIKELNYKFEVYEESGVKEYWLFSPENQYLQINKLVNGKYQSSKPYTSGDIITTNILPSFELDLEAVFNKLVN